MLGGEGRSCAVRVHTFETLTPAGSAVTSPPVSLPVRLRIWEFLQVWRATVHVVWEPPVRSPGGLRGEGVRRPPAGRLGRSARAPCVAGAGAAHEAVGPDRLPAHCRAWASCCTCSSAGRCPSTGPACPLCGSGCWRAGSASPSSCPEVRASRNPRGRRGRGREPRRRPGGGHVFPEMPARLSSGPAVGP